MTLFGFFIFKFKKQAAPKRYVTGIRKKLILSEIMRVLQLFDHSV